MDVNFRTNLGNYLWNFKPPKIFFASRGDESVTDVHVVEHAGTARVGTHEQTEEELAKLTSAQQKEILDCFRSFLKCRGLRETRERFLVLNAVYEIDGHVDADTLHLRLRQQDHRISRATVYNTLNLLLECELVTRHQFGNSQAKYEPSFLFGQHDHLICLDCQKVMEFCDPRIQNIQEMVADVYSFEIKRHALNLYGHCQQTNCVNRGTAKTAT